MLEIHILSPPTSTTAMYLLDACMLGLVGGRKVLELVDLTILEELALGRVGEAVSFPLAAVEVATVLAIHGQVGSLAAVLGKSWSRRI
jgi:hypothetical protein